MPSFHTGHPDIEPGICKGFEVNDGLRKHPTRLDVEQRITIHAGRSRNRAAIDQGYSVVSNLGTAHPDGPRLDFDPVG